MKKKNLFIVILIGVTLAIAFFYARSKRETQLLNIITDQGLIAIQAEVMRTPEDKAKGLMYREELPAGKGMLFVYEKSFMPTFWMKNVKMPIDMIFIDENFVIQTILSNVPPCSSDPCPLYSPTQPAQFILEIPAKYSEKNRIKEGIKIGGINL